MLGIDCHLVEDHKNVSRFPLDENGLKDFKLFIKNSIINTYKIHVLMLFHFFFKEMSYTQSVTIFTYFCALNQVCWFGWGPSIL